MKNKGVKLPFVTIKKQKYLVTFAYKNKTIVTSIYVVNVSFELEATIGDL